MLLWVPYYIICNVFLNTSWEYPINPSSMALITTAFCVSCLISIMFKIMFIPNRKILQPALIQSFSRSARGRFFTFLAFVIAASSVLALFAMKGVTLNVGNYGSRFESNAGTGLFTILSYSMVTVSILMLYKNPTKKALILSAALVLAYGFLLFLTLGGARNYLIAAIIPVLIVAYSLRLISFKTLALLGALGIVMITALALVRYGDSIGSGSVALLALYTRDTVFPVDSLTNILDKSMRYVGFDYFFNQFYSIIPRFLWPGKPIFLDTISYFYTEQMLGYGKGLIMAPTGIGSLYIMGGWPAIFVGTLMVSLFFVCLDYFALRKSVVFYFCAYPSIFFAFFCFRESVELGIYKVLLHSLFALGVCALSTFIYRAMPKKRKIRMAPIAIHHMAKPLNAG
ncbi:putative common antigen polymerase [compost metagenome]